MPGAEVTWNVPSLIAENKRLRGVLKQIADLADATEAQKIAKDAIRPGN